MPRLDLEKITRKIGRIALILMMLTFALMWPAHEQLWAGGTVAYLAWAGLAYLSLLLIAASACGLFASGVVQLIARIRARGMSN